MLRNSLLYHHDTLAADGTITLHPTKSVLRLAFGDPICIRENDFRRLADAFFAEIERRFTDKG